MGEMQPHSDAQLLRDYAERAAEAAFAEILTRHTDLVYSAALRQVYSSDLARDVTQCVFTDLARKARTLSANLSPEASLVGWLYRGTRFAARDLHRNETRRTQRERQAMEQLHPTPETPPDWEQLRPVLDDAMSELDDLDRDAVLLRYFKNHDLRTVGATLGISDDAAQKRVSRALERLRELFAKRGVAVGAGGLVAVISANAVTAAPVGLALSVSHAALAGAGVITTIATHTTMNWINLKSATAILAAALAAGSGSYFVQQHKGSVLRQENQAWKSANDTLSRERDTALAAVESNNAEMERLRASQSDLLRLRAEVTALRKQTDELNQLRQQNRQLQATWQDTRQAAAERNSDIEDELLRQQAIARLNDAKNLVLALQMFAADNQNQLPSDLSQTTNYWKHADRSFTNSDSFEQVIFGSLEAITNRASTIAVRERQASNPKGKWVKAYGFADGHSEIKVEPAEGFEQWEKAHIFTPQPEQP
jgi:RNA polymerase sigma factor (sigma-70 family)